jgi:hypothetical protein
MEDLVPTDGASTILDRLTRSPAERRRVVLTEFIENQLLEILRWDESRRPDLASCSSACRRR